MSIKTVDVIVVGAGIVGMALAVALKQAGIDVGVLDKNTLVPSVDGDANQNPPNYHPRVSAISLASQNLFETLGVWERIVRKAPYTQMDVWEDQAFGRISFDASETNAAHLGHIIENQQITDALINQAQAIGVKLFLGCEISKIEKDDHRQCVTISTQDQGLIQAQLLVGADGGQSFVRRYFNFPMTFWSYDHLAIVANVRTDNAHKNIARQAFSKFGPLAFLPLQDEHYSSIVWSQTTLEAQRLLSLSEKEFCQSLQVAIDNELGNVKLASKQFSYPLKMQYVRQWAQNGVVLAGDAAHTIHPLAGQGANLGLLDAAALVDELAALKAKQKPFYLHKNLRAYERWRKADAVKVIATMEGFKQVFDGNNDLKKLARNCGLGIASRVTPIKRFFIQQATGGSGNLPTLVVKS
ncbi:FAD-dependent monooxygenase [Glaciecola sp. KUL10]|uniref:FAD-dependent monooxygenase n=1 Tax=Glaciecola sp. (strain KUL10) TaxID=2161813 RepID=UPI000D788A06|nr:FAD-dependent monooxygenase [Glaciecola sp. KUL10]GBL05657.1 2-octaprenyl-3-methyl-6-methoxy-1,4-benzoquinol hydroxylase [Glaciecola sp. KUL10]